MVEIGIPVYKARETLPATLDSLVAQTCKDFIICLSIDGDNENYNDIIEIYRARGLEIRVITSITNCGAGAARQHILNCTSSDYIMFVDADDILMPRAVEVLYTNAKAHDYDIVQGSFIREFKDKEDIMMSSTDNVLTWFHGKIYKVSYLQNKKISFLSGLRTDEDAYFNAVAWNSTDNKGLIGEVVYLWRDNKNSITRSLPDKEYFIKTHNDYIRGQVQALIKLHEINETVSQTFITATLINIYYFYMRARFYKCDEEEMNNIISILKEEEWMQLWLDKGENWVDVIQNIKPGQIYDGEYVIFYKETFNLWAARLLRADMKGE